MLIHPNWGGLDIFRSDTQGIARRMQQHKAVEFAQLLCKRLCQSTLFEGPDGPDGPECPDGPDGPEGPDRLHNQVPNQR